MKRASLALAALALATALAWLAAGRGGQTSGVAGPPAAAQGSRATAELAQAAGAAREDERMAEPGAAGAAIPAQAVMRILDPRGAPLAEADWAVFRGEEVLASGRTGADGTAGCALPEPGPLELAVAHRMRPPWRWALALAAGEETVVTLPAGEAIAGTVTVDGLPPPEPFELSLNARAPVFAMGGLPDAVWRALGREPDDVRSLTLEVGTDGVFRFEGLPPGLLLQERPDRPLRENWSWELYWNTTWLLADPQGETPLGFADRQDYLLAQPGEDIALAFQSQAQLRGRVIDPLTGEGSPRANVGWDDGERSGGAGADEQGKFELLFPEALPARLELTVAAEGGAGRRVQAFELPAGARQQDVGDVALALERRVTFTVRTAGGEAIAGAHVRAAGAGWGSNLGAPADAEGRGSLSVGAKVRALRAVALGFEPAEVPLPPGAQEVDVQLDGATVLEVRLDPPDPRLGVELRAADYVFPERGVFNFTPESQAPGTDLSLVEHDDGSRGVVLYGAADGVHVFSGLRTDLALELLVVDSYGGAILRRPVEALARGERRVLTLAIDPPAGSLRGRVLSEGRQALPSASVRIGQFGTAFRDSAFTGADGLFAFDGIASERVELRVTANGYAPWFAAAAEVGPELLEVVLERGRDVLVSIVGPGGKPLPKGLLHAQVPGRPRSVVQGGSLKEAGRAVLRDLPHERLELVVRAGGRSFERELSAEATELRVELPAWQSCTVSIEGGAPRAPGERRFLELHEVGAGPEVWHSAALAGLGDEVVRFEPVFPGRYEAVVQGYIPFDTEVQRLGEPVAFDVTAEAPARVTVRL